jgi:hypothetical protein
MITREARFTVFVRTPAIRQESKRHSAGVPLFQGHILSRLAAEQALSISGRARQLPIVDAWPGARARPKKETQFCHRGLPHRRGAPTADMSRPVGPVGPQAGIAVHLHVIAGIKKPVAVVSVPSFLSPAAQGAVPLS